MKCYTNQISALNVKINALKRKLHESDYLAIKYAEGELTLGSYQETKTQRKKWRAQINELEAEIAALKELSENGNG